MTPAGLTAPPDPTHYPSSDGEPMAETSVHVLLMVALIGTLRAWMRDRQEPAYVIGNIFLYYRQGDPAARRSPDVMVVKGVDPLRHRDSFKTWEEDAVPCVVIELTSAGTADEDQGPKKALYQALGVREYILFDPLGDWLGRPLLAYRLINGEYEELPPAAGGAVVSAELGLRLVPRGTDLDLFDYRTGHPLPSVLDLPDVVASLRQELHDAERRSQRELDQTRRQAQLQVDEQRQRAERAEAQVEAERRQAAQARAEAEALRHEMARLRGLLPPDAPGGPG